MTHHRRNRRVAPKARSTLLSRTQVRWLGALLVAVLLPQTPHVPVWVACAGIGLVGLRLVLADRDGREGGARAALAGPWLLAAFAVAAGFAIRQSFGYSGRDPALPPVRLVGIKFFARARRHLARASLAFSS
jgi:hypothetical protein